MVPGLLYCFIDGFGRRVQPDTLLCLTGSTAVCRWTLPTVGLAFQTGMVTQGIDLSMVFVVKVNIRGKIGHEELLQILVADLFRAEPEPGKNPLCISVDHKDRFFGSVKDNAVRGLGADAEDTQKPLPQCSHL